MYVLGYSGFTRDRRQGGKHCAKPSLTFDEVFEFREDDAPFTLFPLGYFGHDSSAALLRDGRVVACAAEERFTRVKYSLNLAGATQLPRRAIRYCLDAAGVSIGDVDAVAHYCDFRPPLLAERLELLRPWLPPVDVARLEACYTRVFDSMLNPGLVREQFAELVGGHPRRFVPVRHHLAHAASAFYPSGFQEALILTTDGTGETESALLAVGRGRAIHEVRRTPLPASLGTLYLIVTVYLGFRSLGDEYKVMGLAAYGDPRRYRDLFRRLVELEGNGTYWMPALATPGLRELLLKHLGPPRGHGEPISERHADVAAALQERLEEATLHMLRHARSETGLPNLCMAGGVALNCALNGAIARAGLFRSIFVQPAASDEGCSVGAAYCALSQLDPDAPVEPWRHVYWGPEFDDSGIAAALEPHRERLFWSRVPDIAAAVAERLARGQVAGWFQGRMEFGPRALGNRSILADPRDPGMKDRLNAKVKWREPFRPFAPAALAERAGSYFDLAGLPDSPFMLFALAVKPEQRAVIPAVTHVDGTARVQTVTRASNPRFWDLIAAFDRLTGVPVVLNTSFNVRNEPIVCVPRDAVRCLLATDIDCLGIGDYLVEKRGGQ